MKISPPATCNIFSTLLAPAHLQQNHSFNIADAAWFENKQEIVMETLSKTNFFVVPSCYSCVNLFSVNHFIKSVSEFMCESPCR